MSTRRKKEYLQDCDQPCNNKRQVINQMRRCKWDIEFKTPNQEKLYETMNNSDITFCIGPAGTGKSYVSVHFALQELVSKDTKIDGLILCRPMTYLDNESIGYLPGNVEDKIDPFM